MLGNSLGLPEYRFPNPSLVEMRITLVFVVRKIEIHVCNPEKEENSASARINKGPHLGKSGFIG